MPYSFTEKKRIRKSFAKRPAVQTVPFLLATQLESYMQFLQADVAPGGVVLCAVKYSPPAPPIRVMICPLGLCVRSIHRPFY